MTSDKTQRWAGSTIVYRSKPVTASVVNIIMHFNVHSIAVLQQFYYFLHQ